MKSKIIKDGKEIGVIKYTIDPEFDTERWKEGFSKLSMSSGIIMYDDEELENPPKVVAVGNTIKNNDPATTFYTLSILELEEMCETYHEDYDEIDNKHSAIEMLVDYIVSYRK